MTDSGATSVTPEGELVSSTGRPIGATYRLPGLADTQYHLADFGRYIVA